MSHSSHVLDVVSIWILCCAWLVLHFICSINTTYYSKRYIDMQVAFRNCLYKLKQAVTLYAIYIVFGSVRIWYLGCSHFRLSSVDNGISSGRLGFQFKKLYYELWCLCMSVFLLLWFTFFLKKKKINKKKEKWLKWSHSMAHGNSFFSFLFDELSS